MENKQDSTPIAKTTTPAPSTTGQAAGGETIIKQDAPSDLPQNHMSKADEDLAEYESHEQDFGSDDFLSDDGDEQTISKRDEKYAQTLHAVSGDQQKH